MFSVIYYLPVIFIACGAILLFAGKWLPWKGAFIPIIAAFVGAFVSFSSLKIGLEGGLRLPADEYISWFSCGQFEIAGGAYLDGLSLTTLFLFSILMLALALFSSHWIKNNHNLPLYNALLCLAGGCTAGIIISASIFQTAVLFSIAGLTAYAAASLWPAETENAKTALIFSVVADLLLIFSMIYIYFAMGTFRIPQITEQFEQGFISGREAFIAAILIAAAILAKAAQIPFTVNLLKGSRTTAPFLALIYIATTTCGAIYLVVRMAPVFANQPAAAVLLWAGAGTAVLAALSGCLSNDITEITSFSIISQAGLAVAMAGSGQTYDAMLQMVTHGLGGVLMVLAFAGPVAHCGGNTDIRGMGGLKQALPVSYAAALCSCMTLAGVPPFAGFFTKREIAISLLSEHIIVYYIVLAAFMLQAALAWRLFSQVYNGDEGKNVTDGKQEHAFLPSTAMVILALLTIFSGWIMTKNKLIGYVALPSKPQDDSGSLLVPTAHLFGVIAAGFVLPFAAGKIINVLPFRQATRDRIYRLWHDIITLTPVFSALKAGTGLLAAAAEGSESAIKNFLSEFLPRPIAATGEFLQKAEEGIQFQAERLMGAIVRLPAAALEKTARIPETGYLAFATAAAAVLAAAVIFAKL